MRRSVLAAGVVFAVVVSLVTFADNIQTSNWGGLLAFSLFRGLLIGAPFALAFLALTRAIRPRPGDLRRPERPLEDTTVSIPGPQRDGDTRTGVTAGNQELCVVLGIAFLLIGANYLLKPSPGGGDQMGLSVVNLHRLTMGETWSIVGAVLLASGIRPR